MSGVRTEDEGLFVVQHKYWQETMQRALAAETKQLSEGADDVEHTEKSSVAPTFDRGCPAVPVSRGALAGRQGLGRLARLLCAGRRVLDAVLGR